MLGTGSTLLRDAVSLSRRHANSSAHHRRMCTARVFARASPHMPYKGGNHARPAARPCVTCSSTSAQLQSETELFLDNLEKESAAELPSGSDLRAQLLQLESQVRSAPL